MTLDRDRDDLMFECDGCGDTLWPVSGAYDWAAVMSELRDAQWQARKVGDDWCHYCADCKNKVDFR